MKTQKTDDLLSLKIGLIGAGALGNAIALRMHQKGFKVHAVVSQTPGAARRLAAKVKCETVGINFKLLQDCNVVLITVPDSQIPVVETKLLEISFRARKVVVIHTSGTLTSASLKTLKLTNKNKVYIASMHPMQTFPKKIDWNKETLANHFRNIYFGIEGDPAAIRTITKVIRKIGGRSVKIPKELKALYHMGGVFCSNFLIALLYISRNMYTHIGLKEERTVEILLPIITQTLKNVKDHGATASLTGPAARNDVAVIQNHLRTLKKFGPKYQNIYRGLTGVCYLIAKSK